MKNAYPANQSYPNSLSMLVSGGSPQAVDGSLTIGGKPVSATSGLTSGYVLSYNGTAWVSAASAGGAPSGLAGGDLSGTYPNPAVAKINGVALGTTTATSGNILVASGSAWVSVAMSGDATIASTGALTLASTAVSAGSYTGTSLTVDAKGRITAASSVAYLTGNQAVTLTGDATGSGATAIAVTVAKINGSTLGTTTPTSGNVLIGSGTAWVTNSVGGDATLSSAGVLTLASTAVSAGSYIYASITVDAKGRLTAASSGTAPILTSVTNANGLTLSGGTLAFSSATYLLLAGGTMAGNIAMGGNKATGAADPTSPQDYATKNYVDTQVANLTPKADCQCATTTALAASTYNNGTAGVGATITLTVAAVLILDGYTPVLNDRILVKNQAAPVQNGLFAITTLGVLGVTQAVLMRTTDFDQPAEVDGAITFIINGSTNAGTRWQCLTSGTVVFNTTAINWSLFAGSTYSADGTTLSLTGTTFSLITPVAIASGGTGQTTAVAAFGAIAPIDFISSPAACCVQYNSATVIQVGTGSIYNPIDSTVTTISSPLTNTPTLAASTMYYVYLATGGASLVVNSTAPTSNYQGTAWKDASNRRYLGCFLTDASSHIISFQRTGNQQIYQGSSGSAPFAVLVAGQSSTPATVSCAGVVPPTSRLAKLILTNNSNNYLFMSNSLGPTVSGSAGIMAVQGTSGAVASYSAQSQADFPLAGQSLTYCYNAFSSGSGFYIYVLGFVEDR